MVLLHAARAALLTTTSTALDGDDPSAIVKPSLMALQSYLQDLADTLKVPQNGSQTALASIAEPHVWLHSAAGFVAACCTSALDASCTSTTSGSGGSSSEESTPLSGCDRGQWESVARNSAAALMLAEDAFQAEMSKQRRQRGRRESGGEEENVVVVGGGGGSGGGGKNSSVNEREIKSASSSPSFQQVLKMAVGNCSSSTVFARRPAKPYSTYWAKKLSI